MAFLSMTQKKLFYEPYKSYFVLPTRQEQIVNVCHQQKNNARDL